MKTWVKFTLIILIIALGVGIIIFSGVTDKKNKNNKNTNNNKDIKNTNNNKNNDVPVKASGECGVNGSDAKWVLDCEGMMTITGNGEISPLSSDRLESIWYEYEDDINSVSIAEGVTNIGTSAFRGCRNLESINIPESVTDIGPNAFSGCDSLTSINIPEGVMIINRDTFSGCSSLENINISENVRSIGVNAFYGCSRLKNINIPEGVTSIGKSAFEGCSSLKSITIPKGVTSIHYTAFKNVDLKYVNYGGTQDMWSSISTTNEGTILSSALKHYGNNGDVPTHEWEINNDNYETGESNTTQRAECPFCNE